MTILDHDFLAQLHAFGKGEAVTRKLSLLIRPAMIARPGKKLVWGDWSQVEARALPWLSDSRGGEKVLDVFRASDRDPSLPDIYSVEAAGIFGKTPEEVWVPYKDSEPVAFGERQIGKVAILSLGFGGSVGAFTAMATNYGVYVDPKRAAEIVAAWRAANPWAKAFWGAHGREGSYGLWGAICSALESPGTIFPVGRVAYVYDPSYMRGTLFCALPSGRLLTYPSIKWETREVEDKKTKKLEWKTQLTFRKQYGRVALWYGKAAENITQATATGCLLRGKLVELEYGYAPQPFDGYPPLEEPERYVDYMPVVAHTHDEIVCECEDHPDTVEAVKGDLHRVMATNDYWNEGLPLAVEMTARGYYTKAKE